MGFLDPWTKFNTEAIAFWYNRDVRKTFSDFANEPVYPPHTIDVDITDESHGFEVLHSWFQREVRSYMYEVFVNQDKR